MPAPHEPTAALHQIAARSSAAQQAWRKNKKDWLAPVLCVRRVCGVGCGGGDGGRLSARRWRGRAAGQGEAGGWGALPALVSLRAQAHLEILVAGGAGGDQVVEELHM